MVTLRLDRLTDSTLDELYLTLHNAVRSDEYANKPILLAHAEEVFTAVRQERIDRINRQRYPHVHIDYVSQS